MTKRSSTTSNRFQGKNERVLDTLDAFQGLQFLLGAMVIAIAEDELHCFTYSTRSDGPPDFTEPTTSDQFLQHIPIDGFVSGLDSS